MARAASAPFCQAARAVMVLRSLHELTAAQIAGLLECHPGTARRWIVRFNAEGLAGLADRPRSGRPRLGGRRLTRRIAALLARPGPWTLISLRPGASGAPAESFISPQRSLPRTTRSATLTS